MILVELAQFAYEQKNNHYKEISRVQFVVNVLLSFVYKEFDEF